MPMRSFFLIATLLVCCGFTAKECSQTPPSYGSTAERLEALYLVPLEDFPYVEQGTTGPNYVESSTNPYWNAAYVLDVSVFDLVLWNAAPPGESRLVIENGKQTILSNINQASSIQIIVTVNDPKKLWFMGISGHTLIPQMFTLGTPPMPDGGAPIENFGRWPGYYAVIELANPDEVLPVGTIDPGQNHKLQAVVAALEGSFYVHFDVVARTKTERVLVSDPYSGTTYTRAHTFPLPPRWP